MDNATILVVEDEPVIALDIKRRLTRLGYQVAAIADSAETALAAASTLKPDLVLMDIHIRGPVDGIATAAQIRDQFNLPVVFLTAHADAATLMQAKNTQPFGYIVKPFENHDLNTTIEIALARHQSEIAIQRALEKEKEMHALKSRFVSIVSHEFRNPLSAILFSLDLLERQDPQIPPEKRRLCIQRARDAVLRMEQLLEDVLAIGEIQSSGFQYQPRPVDVVQFCQDLATEFQLQAGAKCTIEFIAVGWDGITAPCHDIDPKLLRHILTNLLSNAIKYSPQGGEIRFDLIRQPETITFRIQDQGIGIPTADQARLFDVFQRGSNVNTIPGTGLGLSIVKQCVDAHGGEITVESQVGLGTALAVILHRQP